MLELGKHIEWLLQDNDCVIVPELGGFITHNIPARRSEEDNCFLPPTRMIGFNPLLKLNDGLLVQSYMAVHQIDFSEASRKVTNEINRLLIQLHETGKVKIGNIGELSLSLHGTYTFSPAQQQLSTAALYGLVSFSMCELKDFKQSPVPHAIPLNATKPQKNNSVLRITTSYISNAAAMIAIIALFFFLPTPIENTEITEENYAQLLPSDIFERIEKQSLAITPIIIKNQKQAPITVQTQKQPAAPKKKNLESIIVKEVKVKESRPEVIEKVEVQKAPTKSPSPTAIVKPVLEKKQYHIIVASVSTENDAKAMAEQLIKQGHAGAKAIIGNGKMRVCIESYTTEKEAYQFVNNLRKNEIYQSAWVLKQ